jgi:hypothetical protein
MPFGLGFGELLLVLAMFGVPVAVVLVAAKALSRAFGSSRSLPTAESQRLTGELQQAQLRIEELESKLERVDEKATFTQQLLEERRPDSAPGSNPGFQRTEPRHDSA